MGTSNGTITNITFRVGELTVYFSDGRKLTTPLVWYPRLLNASPKQRANWQVLGRDRGIHWPEVDEDLSIEGMMRGQPSPEYRKPKRSPVKKHSSPEQRI